MVVNLQEYPELMQALSKASNIDLGKHEVMLLPPFSSFDQPTMLLSPSSLLNQTTKVMKINLTENTEVEQALSKAGYNFDLSEYPELFLAFLPQFPNFTKPTGNVSPETKEMLDKLKLFACDVIDENKMSLHNSSRSIRRSYWTLYLMYSTLFLVGVVTAIVAIIRGFTATGATDTYSSLIFAGLSAGSFFTLFITRPLESLERNSIFSSWLIAITNTYWTEYAYFDDPNKAYADLKKATDDLTKGLSDLADKHAAAIGKYPALTSSDAKISPSSKPGQDGKPDNPKP